MSPSNALDSGTRAKRTGQLIRSLASPAARNVVPFVLDLGCCDICALDLDSPSAGAAGEGWKQPAQEANVLVVAGRLSERLVPYAQDLYARLAPPRWVICCGTCATSGALLDTVPLPEMIPVDVFIPGCPPHTDALESALSALARRRRDDP